MTPKRESFGPADAPDPASSDPSDRESASPLCVPGPIPASATGAEADARRIAEAVRAAGGRALVVGGYVRDRMLGLSSSDLDVEAFGLAPDRLGRALRPLGRIHRTGRSFPVLRVAGFDVEVALPRRESKTGPGHRGFDAEADPDMTFREAAERRDLTLNAMGLDPLTGELFDPFGGADDLAAGMMRATSVVRFPEDPLRGLRVAGFAARFGFAADDRLHHLCARLDLSELSAERIFDELDKLLMKGVRPSVGLHFLRETDLLRFFPELAALAETPQDRRHHPEGDVFEHTVLALDHAAKMLHRDSGSEEDDRVLMFAVLCHDLGKPGTTVRRGDRITSPGHDVAGAGIARGFLERLRAPRALVLRVEALTRRHLAPALHPPQNAGRGAYRRLARELAAAGTTLEMLLRVATADQLGRTTPEALAGEFPAGDAFRRLAEEFEVFRGPPVDAVSGRHVLARGVPAGRGVGRILDRSREIQDETGKTDPDLILDRALAEEREAPARPGPEAAP